MAQLTIKHRVVSSICAQIARAEFSRNMARGLSPRDFFGVTAVSYLSSVVNDMTNLNAHKAQMIPNLIT